MTMMILKCVLNYKMKQAMKIKDYFNLFYFNNNNNKSCKVLGK